MNRSRLALFVILLAAAPSLAMAYTGPGAGISAIGSVLAVVGAIGFAIIGFVWYPVRRLIRVFRRNRDQGSDES